MFEKEEEEEEDLKPDKLLSRIINNFALDLTLVILPEHNVLFSPLSIASRLTSLCLGAKGMTLKQIESELKLSSIKNRIHFLFKNFRETWNSKTKNFTWKTFDKIYINKMISIPLYYKSYFKHFYPDSITNDTFPDARVKINDLVTQLSGGIINDMMPKCALDDDLLILLVNAIFFHSKWDLSFKDIGKKDYNLNGSTISHDAMIVSSHFNYRLVPEFDLIILELPMSEHFLSMLLFVPRNHEQLFNFNRVITYTNFNALMNLKGFDRGVINLQLPKFSLRSSVDMKIVLNRLNITDLFDAGLSNLFNMPENTIFPYVSNYIHKLYMYVNENGFNKGNPDADPEGLYVSVNGPFGFYIIDNNSKIILLAGTVIDPRGGWPPKKDDNTCL